jgi:WD40 repeat protein
MRHVLALLLSIMLLSVLGCSSGSPTTPTGASNSQPTPDSLNYQVLSAGVMNLETGTVEPDREAEGYLNVTGLVGSNFRYTINGWSSPGVLDITLSLNNASSLTVNDVYIVFEELTGKKVMNQDGMIDIYGANDLDPFIAFRKESPTRAFPPGLDTEPLLLSYPGSGIYVSYFIIAHLGGNTGGVWNLTDWTATGSLYPSGGSSDVTVKVWDWQNDVSGVVADTTVLTGGYKVFIKSATPQIWGATIVNSAGAPVGDYSILVRAQSPASPTYSYYNRFVLTVEQEGATGIEPLFNAALPTGDTAFDVCVAPDGYAFVLADHPATGNVGGIASLQGTRTALRYINNLTMMQVIAPGTGVVDPFDAYGYPWADWPGECTRIECSADGTILNTNVGRQLVTYLELSDVTVNPLQGTYAWCGAHDFNTTMIDVCAQIANDGIYGEVLYGMGELPDPCASGSGIPLGDQRTLIDRADYYVSDVATTADAGLNINDNLVAIDGWDNTNDTVLFMSGPDLNALVVYTGATFGGIGALSEKARIYENEFEGAGLDVAVDSAGNIVTLEAPGTFRKFDSTYAFQYSADWTGQGTAMRIDFDRGDDVLYVLSNSHITACLVN